MIGWSALQDLNRVRQDLDDRAKRLAHAFRAAGQVDYQRLAPNASGRSREHRPRRVFRSLEEHRLGEAGDPALDDLECRLRGDITWRQTSPAGRQDEIKAKVVG